VRLEAWAGIEKRFKSRDDPISPRMNRLSKIIPAFDTVMIYGFAV